jgi:hypothetical protein
MIQDKGNLVLLDFTEHDTLAALTRLTEMAKAGQISGVVFSVMLTSKNEKRVMLGATGRASRNLIEATGLSAMLHCNLTQIAMQHIEHTD